MTGRSIRSRLTLATTGLVALVGLLFGASTYLWLTSNLRAEARAFAVHEAGELAYVIAGARDRAELERLRPSLAQLYPEADVLAIEVWSLEGELVYGVPGARTPLLGPWPAALERARGGEVVVEEQDFNGEGAVRAALRVDFAREPRWIVTTAVKDQVANSRARFLSSFALGLGVALAVTLAGSYVLVGRALRPVQDLVAEASLLAREGPGGRLTEPRGSELAELVALLNAMLARTEETVARLRSFTAHAGHELRTPLTRIRGEAEAALRDGSPARRQEALESILEELDEQRRVIDGLLELARSGDPVRDHGVPPLDLSELLSEVAEEAGPIGREAEVTILRDGPERGLLVRGSRALLARVLWNLLDNALKFSPPGGRVRLEVATEEQRVVVSVSDEGPGFGGDPEPLFEPFARGEDAPPGHGLGLALSRSIARRHGGDVIALARAEGGATLRLTLPREPAPEPAPVASGV
ncbi:MAG: sensor histidine kinase [Planctomycetota bacterium]